METLKCDLPGCRVAGGTAKAENHTVSKNSQIFFTCFVGKLIAPTGAEYQTIASLLQGIEDVRAN